MCLEDKDILLFKSSGYRIKYLKTSTTNTKFPIIKSSTDQQKTLKNYYFQQTSSETECIFSCLINLVYTFNLYMPF